MRMGLPKVLTSDQGGEFRSDLEKREGQAVHSTIPVFCHCRLPDDGGLMVSCSNCEEWFHKECETVPEIVWLKKNKKHIWFCKNC